MTPYSCHICGRASGCTHVVREMMFGTQEAFNYWECKSCGCLQLINPPLDLAKYYPHDKYYSFRGGTSTMRRGVLQIYDQFRLWLRKRRNAAICFQQKGLFAWLARWRPNPMASRISRWLRDAEITSFDTRILDLGCGEGQILRELALLGFTSLVGVDPFLQSDRTEGVVKLVKQPLSSLDGQVFDWIMLHHSLEHMPDQHGVFQLLRRLVSPTGRCLIRIPLASMGPWQRYQTDWVELDAPRHFLLHTEESLGQLAAAHGFQVDRVEYEAEPFAYAMSELYRSGRPLFDDDAGRFREWREVFSASECADFERLALEDQQSGRAGRAAFHLSLASPTVHDRG